MHRHFLTCAFLIASLACSFGQGLDLTNKAVDSNQVWSVWDSWSVRVFAAQKSLGFSIRDKTTDTYTRFTPNNRFSVGVGMTYKWISFDIGLNIRPKGNEITKRLDLDLTLNFSRNFLSLKFQRYRGFDVAESGGKDYEFRSDIVSRVAGFNFIRAQPDRMLSLKSLSAGLHVTKKSTGVLGYGAYWYWDRIRGDSAFIPVSLSELYSERGLVDYTRHIDLGVTAGYAYSLVLPMDFFIFASGFPGIGLNLGRLESDKRYIPPPFPALRVTFNAALGYAGPKIYVVLSGSGGWNGVSWGDETRYHYQSVRVKLSVGYRLYSTIPFLEKVANSFGGI